MDELARQPQGATPPLPALGRGAARRLKTACTNLPLRTRLFVLLSLAVLAGAAVTLLAAATDRPFTWLWLALPGLIALTCAAAQRSISTPMERLIQELDALVLDDRVQHLNLLPIARHDEVGRIARATHRLGALAVRHRLDARRLRRTIDSEIARATRQSTRQLRRLTLRDPLTNLGNRRYIDQHLEPVVQLVQQAHAELIAVLIDIDQFKQVNDNHGHDQGDKLLVMLAGIIRASTRRDDLTARLGGDEFVIFMPDANIQRATQLTQAIRGMFCQQIRATLGAQAGVNLSMGVALLQRDRCNSGKDLIRRADEHLYEAKRAGKARTWGLTDN